MTLTGRGRKGSGRYLSKSAFRAVKMLAWLFHRKRDVLNRHQCLFQYHYCEKFSVNPTTLLHEEVTASQQHMPILPVRIFQCVLPNNLAIQLSNQLLKGTLTGTPYLPRRMNIAGNERLKAVNEEEIFVSVLSPTGGWLVEGIRARVGMHPHLVPPRP